MVRFFRALALGLALLLLVGACSAGSSDKAGYDPQDSNSEAPYNGEDYGKGSPRQVIYQASLDVSVADLNSSIVALSQKAAALGGYIANSYRDNSREKPSARISFRIPQARYQEFLQYAREQGEPGQEKVDSTDVTEEYLDLEARLANRRVHEERLLELFTQSGSIEELLAVERELARVREDIEIIEGRLRYLTDRVSMATVEIQLIQKPGETEVPGLKPVGIGETLRRSLRALINSSTLFLDILSYIFIILAALLPFAVPIGLVIWLIFRLRRRSKSPSQEA